MIAGLGLVLARSAALIYRETQLRIHVIVTHAFLRSLARTCDLVESSVEGPRLARRRSRR